MYKGGSNYATVVVVVCKLLYRVYNLVPSPKPVQK